ncbi:MAG: histidinol dehydrogenase, partial [Alphaproteobacteria bacterium]
MAKHLKERTGEAETREYDANVRRTVEDILADIEARGDAAIRALSEKFDKWSPESFRLSDAEISDLVASVPPETIDDIT